MMLVWSVIGSAAALSTSWSQFGVPAIMIPFGSFLRIAWNFNRTTSKQFLRKYFQCNALWSLAHGTVSTGWTNHSMSAHCTFRTNNCIFRHTFGTFSWKSPPLCRCTTCCSYNANRWARTCNSLLRHPPHPLLFSGWYPDRSNNRSFPPHPMGHEPWKKKFFFEFFNRQK